MRINFAQFPIYDGIKKEKLIANNITEAYGDWIYKNVAGLKAHLLAEKIFKSTAEGVENKEQLDFLVEQECDEIQGYYFSKPLPLEELKKLLNKI